MAPVDHVIKARLKVSLLIYNSIFYFLFLFYLYFIIIWFYFYNIQLFYIYLPLLKEDGPSLMMYKARKIEHLEELALAAAIHHVKISIGNLHQHVASSVC